MQEGPGVQKSTEILKTSHLAEGIKPIFICVGSAKDFLNESEFSPQYMKNNFGTVDVRKVDQGEGTYEGKKEESLTAGPSTYIISPIDSDNKFSENFHRCTGLVVVGIDKKTGKDISFLSHQDPIKFLNKNDEFISDLNQRLKEMKERCKQNSIDAIIVGGRYFSDQELDSYQVSQLYTDSVKLLGKVVEETLEFKPIISNGPKTSRKGENIVFDTKNRRLYFVRPEVNEKTGDFLYDDIGEKTNTWE